MRSDWLSPTDRQWREVLDGAPHDTYHLPEYVRLSAVEDGGEPVAFYARRDDAFLFVPLLIRRFGRHFDATSPYGYPGPICGGEPRGIVKLVDAFSTACKRRQIVSLFLRLHPLLNQEPIGALDSQAAGETVYIDLSRPATYRHGHETDLQRLARLRFRVEFDDRNRYDTFQRLYAETMDRLQAHPQYRFSPTYFERLAGLAAAHLVTVLAPDGRIASAAILFETNGIVQYHLAATANEFLHLAPSKLLIARAAEWARERGNRFFHLGGGVGASADDGLFAFKAGFSDLRAPYRVVRAVIMRETYDQLSAPVPVTDFFPRYRAVRTVRS